MLGKNLPKVLLLLSISALCASSPNSLTIASAQNSSSPIPEDYATPYNREYPMSRLDVANGVVGIQTATHLARQNANMGVFGDVDWYVLDELDRVAEELGYSADWRSDVTIDILNEEGNIVAQYPAHFWDSSEDEGDFGGGFLVELALYAEDEVFTVRPGFHLADSIMDAVNPEVHFYITTLPESEFIVSNPSTFEVLAANKTYEVDIASSTTVDGFAFNQNEKKISFTVAPGNVSMGVAQLAIPTELLSGEIMILRDGVEIPLNQAILIIEKDSFYTAEVSYSPQETHTIEILGTEVIPEFHVIIVLLFASFIGLVVLLTRSLNPLRWRSDKFKSMG